ncbi:hypothetical protein LSAT2_001444 [Lamellibrachia satsuma]|nr:hypothetical protein LSAT2_001444 [Lamellibrachia satsuma]
MVLPVSSNSGPVDISEVVRRAPCRRSTCLENYRETAFVFFESKRESDPLKMVHLNRVPLKSADFRLSAFCSRIVRDNRRNRGKLDAHSPALCRPDNHSVRSNKDEFRSRLLTTLETTTTTTQCP